jgi:LL-diaminopimelate aminotransferase
MPLLEENDFLPDLDKIDPQDLNRVKLMFLNYPNNPTGAVADEKFFKNVVRLATKHNIIVAHDCAYSEVAYDGFKPMSFLEVEGAKEIGIEFHSLSKTFNMTGWRIGFACGQSKIIELLAKVKSNIDSGIFQAIQWAGITALENNGKFLDKLNKVYQERRDILVAGFNSLGWKVNKPKATFYVWVPVPSGYTSTELCQMLLEKAHIIVTPGTGFGENGEGYIRLALTVPAGRIKQVVSRIKKLHKK